MNTVGSHGLALRGTHRPSTSACQHQFSSICDGASTKSRGHFASLHTVWHEAP